MQISEFEILDRERTVFRLTVTNKSAKVSLKFVLKDFLKLP